MKIKSISIDNFGKFKNFSIVLNNGINVIFGRNEQGKSTLMAFVRMMFYGANSGGSDIAKYPRKKYAPWDGSVMSGAIEFTHSGKEFRLEKVFSNSVRTDKTKLFDKDTSTEIEFSDNREIGKMFFGMGEEAFERSLYIGQSGTLIDNAGSGNSEIISKLQNLVSSGNEKQSFTDIYSRLSKAYEIYWSRGGRIGIIDKKKTELAELEDKIIIAKQTEKEKEMMLQQYDHVSDKCDILNSEISELEKEKTRLSESIKVNEINNLLRLKKDEDRLRNELNRLQTNFSADGVEADQRFLEETTIILNDLSKNESLKDEFQRQLLDLRKKMSELTKERENAPSIESVIMVKEMQKRLDLYTDDLNSQRLKLSEINVYLEREKNRSDKLKVLKKKNIASVIMFIFTVFILAASVVSGVIINAWFFGGIAAALLLGAIATKNVLFTKRCFSEDPDKPVSLEKCVESIGSYKKEADDLKRSIKQKEDDSELLRQELEEKLELNYFSNDRGIDDLLSGLNILNDRIRNTAEDIKTKEGQLNGIENKVRESSVKIFEERKAFFGDCDTNGAFARIEELRTAFYSISSVKSQLTDKSKEIRIALNGRTFPEIESELGSYGEFEPLQDTDNKMIRDQIISIEAKLSDLRREYERLRSETVKIRTEMEQSFRDKPELSEIDDKIRTVRRDIDHYSAKARAIDLAREVLKESFEEMQRSFGPIVNEKTADIFSELTCGKYTELSVSKELNISVREPSGNTTIDWKYLSSGTADQLYFALRLAIAEFFSERSGGLPLFLDDPFMQYDDERSAGAAEFIRQYAALKENQILLFTCHGSTLQYFQDGSVICL